MPQAPFHNQDGFILDVQAQSRRDAKLQSV
jgi:hypothetical protein